MNTKIKAGIATILAVIVLSVVVVIISFALLKMPEELLMEYSPTAVGIITLLVGMYLLYQTAYNYYSTKEVKNKDKKSDSTSQTTASKVVETKKQTNPSSEQVWRAPQQYK